MSGHEHLPEAVDRLVNWKRVHDSLAGFRKASSQQPNALPTAYSEETKAAFETARQYLEEDLRAVRKREYIWAVIGLILGIGTVLVPLLGKDVKEGWNAWVGVGVATAGQGLSAASLYFGALKYLRGADRLRHFLTTYELAFRSCRTDEQHAKVLDQILEEIKYVRPPIEEQPAGKQDGGAALAT